ncbi:MAG: hypothetical protein WBN14_17935, partial [Polyangiales bacterium]
EPTRILVSISPSKVGEVGDVCARYGVPFEKIGTVTGQTVAIEGVCEVPVEELAESHASALDSIVS